MAFYFTLFLVLQAILHIEGSAFKHQGYTPLKINEIACTAEKLKVSSSFLTKYTVMSHYYFLAIGSINLVFNELISYTHNSKIMIIHSLEQRRPVYL